MEKSLEKVEEKAKKIKELREKMDTIEFQEKNLVQNLPDPYKIAHNFIMEKGLKLYGGEALHELLEKYNKPLYSKLQLPDYDVFSPNAFEHAKELAMVYYKLGFPFVEVKASVANDNTHQTYKVSIDFNYVLDITQVGCTTSQIKLNKCDECGSNKGKCLDIFNTIPAVDIEKFNPENKNNQIVTKTYDYKTNEGLYKNSFFLCSPEWLKGSLYLERSVPFGDPSRIEKIDKRSNLFTEFYEFNKTLCNKDFENGETKIKEINKKVDPFLKKIKPFLQKEKAVFYGIHAFLFFVKNSSFKKSNIPSCFRVYIQNGHRAASKIHSILSNSFRKENFKLVSNLQYWKGPDYDNVSIMVKINNKYYELIRITNTSHCMPYVRYNKTNFVTIDRLKYILYFSLAFQPILTEIIDDPLQYACLLSDLIEAEKEFYENNKDVSALDGKHKFRSYVLQCEGKEVNKIVENLVKREKIKASLLRKSIYLPDFPIKNMDTKITPNNIENKTSRQRFKPFLNELEQKQNKLSKKKYKQLLTKEFKKKTKKKENKKGLFSKNRFLGFL